MATPTGEARIHILRKLAGLHAVSQKGGKMMERDAKVNATWRDRTSNTRANIHGGATKEGKGSSTIYLSHGSVVGTYLEFGTGIYGPKGRPIRAKNGGYLKITLGGKGGVIYRKEVKGMPAQPIIKPTGKKNAPKIAKDIVRYLTS